ncbi:hypothetical protein AB4M78_07550 [Staphylococcus pasteuri]|uniref:hypothetical protein n=1 Tax=Staphylococcus pasteuri TaxID=45972 RepID=UPI0034C689FC
MYREYSNKNLHICSNERNMEQKYPELIEVFEDVEIDLKGVANGLLDRLSNKGYNIGQIKEVITIQKALSHHKKDYIKHRILSLSLDQLDERVDYLTLDKIKD